MGRYCSRVCSIADHQKHYPQQKPCEQCGTIFMPRTTNKGRFCSTECFRASIARPVKLCEYCGINRVPKDATQYCSVPCRIEGERKHHRKPCAHCGGPCTKDPTATYCSRKCFAKAKTQAKPACKRCGKPVLRNSALYCDQACYQPLREPNPCSMCGKPARRNRRTCSSECAASALTTRAHPPETLERLRLFAENGKTRYQIAELLHMTLSAVTGLAARHEITVARKIQHQTRPPCPICGGATKTKRKYCGPRCHQEGERRRIASMERRPDPLRYSMRPVSQKIRKVVKGAPIPIPLREVYRWGFQLGCPRTIEAISRAIKAEQPNHPGFKLSQ